MLDGRTDDALALASCAHHVAYIVGDYERGQEGMARALRLNPNSATALLYGGWVMNYTGRAAEALPLFQRVRRLSPLHPQIGIASCGIGVAQMMLGDFEAARASRAGALGIS